MNEAVLDASDIHKSYVEAGRAMPIIQGASLRVSSGERVAIIALPAAAKALC